MNMTITMNMQKLIKNPDTKTTYFVDKEETSVIDERQYNNITCDDTLSWFRRFGGSETAQRGYTEYGYRIVKLTSASPNKQHKTIREFSFLTNQ